MVFCLGTQSVIISKIHASIFIGNKARGQGGGAFLFVYRGKMEMTETLFENNEITEDFRGDALGGGLRTGNGTSTIQRCAFINNNASKQGGALWVGENDKSGHSNLIQNCTFVENQSEGGLAGAVMVGAGSSTIMNTTFWNNTAQTAGALFGGANYNIQNTIFFDNTSTNEFNQDHQIYREVNITNRGGNIQYLSSSIEVSSSNNIQISGSLEQDPLLENSLDYNAGFTPVLKLQANSPAKGIGSTGNNAPTTDQINQSRSGRNDAGAYQLD